VPCTLTPFPYTTLFRSQRRPLLIIGDAGRALSLASIPVAYAFHALHTWQLFVVAFATGVLTVFFDVAYQAYLPSFVGREHLVERSEGTRLNSSHRTISY